MSHPASRLSSLLRPRLTVLPVAAVAVVALMPLATQSAAPARSAPWTPLSPASVTFASSTGSTVRAGLLGFNDFHGAIDKPTGSGGLVNGAPAGGSEYLATTVKELRAAHTAAGQPVLTLAAGDLIGASPLVSAAFHDEPAIEEMNNLGLDISSVGNHEFDEGTTELKRMQNGGCHPTDGCQDGDGFTGADFHYLSANVVDKVTRQPLFPAYEVRRVGGIKVGFIGETLLGTPGIVNPAGITTVDFLDEASTANFWANKLRKEQGVKAFVLLIHQGGTQPVGADPSGCAAFAGDITPIVANLDPMFGVVISGHTHRFYSCALPNKSGANSVVTSAGANGVLVTDINVTLAKGTGSFVAASARNVLVSNTDPARIDAGAKAIADKYRTAIAPIANRIVGSITADITRAAAPSQETALGDVIADGMVAYTTGAGAQLAFMNPGGIRADLVYAGSPAGEGDGNVTFGECFTVQPFNNLVVTVSLTGAQIKAILEQQLFSGTTLRILQVSNGFTYSYDSTLGAGNRVSDMALNGVPIDPAATYKVSTNDFLANGGDGFTNFSAATGRVTAPGFDVDALAAYLGSHAPVSPGPQNRITKIA
ncbi:MAG: bifunctional metallophosphatase/5'-nucleotidase [Actinomycetota bacterium]|nr:bifunctional metallophosphatase/5'-nucleotidase [Actinomycetota bacterium]